MRNRVIMECSWSGKTLLKNGRSFNIVTFLHEVRESN
jgi:hypothetical protein